MCATMWKKKIEAMLVLFTAKCALLSEHPGENADVAIKISVFSAIISEQNMYGIFMYGQIHLFANLRGVCTLI